MTNSYFAWLIEPKSNASANELQFYGIDLAGHEGWQNTVVFAYKYATKEEAERVAIAKGFDNVNIVEHGWGP